jgi:ribonucleoside-diphosphate reductase alpha chain
VNTIRRKFRIGGTKGYLHVGLYEDGSPGEIFLRVSHQGSAVSGMLDAWAMTFSNALQYGTRLEDLVRLHQGHRCEPNGPTGVAEVPVCTSIHDFVVRWMRHRFLEAPARPPEQSHPEVSSRVSGSGEFCPECGAEAHYHGGCLCCACGWTRCG